MPRLMQVHHDVSTQVTDGLETREARRQAAADKGGRWAADCAVRLSETSPCLLPSPRLSVLHLSLLVPTHNLYPHVRRPSHLTTLHRFHSAFLLNCFGEQVGLDEAFAVERRTDPTDPSTSYPLTLPGARETGVGNLRCGILFVASLPNTMDVSPLSERDCEKQAAHTQPLSTFPSASELTTGELVEHVIKPRTESRRCRFVELADVAKADVWTQEANGGNPFHFVSHAFGALFRCGCGRFNGIAYPLIHLRTQTGAQPLYLCAEAALIATFVSCRLSV